LKVLVTGGGGMLARDLVPALSAEGHAVTDASRARLDIRNAAHVEGVLASLRPEAVVNCAAFTEVDACETNPAAEEVNSRAVAGLAGACARAGARLVQISTDFVFDGAKRAPYVEEDEPHPLSAYGRTKLAGERAALSAPGALVVRASWLFGRGGPNFVEAMLRQAEAGSARVRVVSDQVGRPTATTDLSEAVAALLAAGASGIVHFANAGEVSWNAFARAIFRLAGRPEIEVAEISSEDLARPARRPPYSVLSTAKYECLTGRAPRDFREPLAEYLTARAAARTAKKAGNL
jgi:dTDP-4-dehydrorhamnose reductase